MSSPELRALYHAPEAERNFQYPIDTTGNCDVETKQAYFSQLRSSVRKLQNEVNVFLTAKMEDEKKKGADTGASKQSEGTKDEEEEANYGEEKIEDE